jgi:hypothetical protein
MIKTTGEFSRREFVHAASAAAAVMGTGIGTGAAQAATPTGGNEICRMDAVTLAEKIRTKQLSPTEVTEAVLARMEKLNPVLGAFCTPTPDIARQQAKQVEADIMAGKQVGRPVCLSGSRIWSLRRESEPHRVRSSIRTMCPTKTMLWSSG